VDTDSLLVLLVDGCVKGGYLLNPSSHPPALGFVDEFLAIFLAVVIDTAFLPSLVVQVRDRPL
jgi:hypothetical protein